MNRPDDRGPDPGLDRELSRLISDAVSDVEPADRLGQLRARTASPSRRPWLFAVGGAAVATAAVITAIAVVGNDPGPTTDPGPAGTPPTTTAPSAPSTSTSAPTPTENEQEAVAAYFVGDTPRGPRLYREFQPVSSPTPGLAGLALLESGPLDPDYQSLWPTGSFDRVSDPESGLVHVYLGDAAPAEPTALAVQQVVYTVSAGFQEPLAVVFHRAGQVTDEVAAAPPLQTLSLVNLSDPSEGQPVSGTLQVRGVANSFEASVPWQITSGDEVVAEYSFTAEGSMGNRLWPFEGTIDVSSLDPGTYTLIVKTDDPTGGAEGFGPFSDTRTIVIE